VEQGKSINKLTVNNLNVLLDWHQVKMPQKSKKEDKLGRWMQILVEGWQPPEYQRWLDVGEQRLLALLTSKIGLTDTCYGRELKHCKRKLEAAGDHMSQDDQITMRRRFDGMDAAEALAALDKAGIKEAVQPTTDPLPFGPGKWLNKRGG
jgi:hypothetical protein